jgi:hypothetical protein
MSSIKKFQVYDKEIIVVDYANCKEVEMMELAQKATDLIKEDASSKLVLSRYSNMFITPAAVRFFEREAKAVQPFLAKNALIGLNTPKKMILKGFNLLMGTDFRAFDSEKEAIEFLTNAALPEDFPSAFKAL